MQTAPGSLIDSHAHLDFYEDASPVLARARAAGVRSILAIGIGDGPETMHRALELARLHPDVFASAGIHPQQADQATPANLHKLTIVASDARCIAVGEIGLDYYHFENPDSAVQHAAFRAQMKVAAALRKPILLHCRTSELATPAARERFGTADAADDLLTLLETEWAPTGLPGVLHCFSGRPEDAGRALALGFYLSFAGNLTYPKSLLIQQVAREAPADRILLETDSPFLSPVPLRGRENEPAHITHTAAFLAELRGLRVAAISDLTTSNFYKLFPMTKPEV